MSQLKTLYEWSPEEVEAWRLWADGMDSFTRNKIHLLLDAHLACLATEAKAQLAKAAAVEALEAFTELLPVIRAGIRKGPSKQVTEDLISDLIKTVTKISEWKFASEQVPVLLKLPDTHVEDREKK